MAARLDVSPSEVSAWEEGDPSFSLVDRAVAACGTTVRLVVGEPEPDPHDVSLLDGTLRLTPEQRLDRLTRFVRFIQAGREAMRGAR